MKRLIGLIAVLGLMTGAAYAQSTLAGYTGRSTGTLVSNVTFGCSTYISPIKVASIYITYPTALVSNTVTLTTTLSGTQFTRLTAVMSDSRTLVMSLDNLWLRPDKSDTIKLQSSVASNGTVVVEYER